MSLDLLKEIFLFGNLDLFYSIGEIRKYNLEIFMVFLRSIKKEEISEGFIWRFYNNMDFIINSQESVILKKEDKNREFFDSLYKIIKLVEEIKFSKPIPNHQEIKKTIRLETIKKKQELLFVVLLNLLIRKVHTKLKLYEIDRGYFYEKFEEYETEKSFHFYLDCQTSYDYIKWTSSWKLVSREDEIVLSGIDIFLDSYFKNYNLYYNDNMQEDIRLLTERIKNLKIYAPSYFVLLKKNSTQVTEKLYNIMPYNKIFKNYKQLIDSDPSVYRNKLLKNEENITDQKWFFSLLPEFFAAYLLGFPIVSLDVPGERIIKKYIKYMEEKGEPKDYYTWFSDNFNKKYLESIEFESEIGNGDEDNESVDLCYVKIKDYNQDDIVSIFNNNIMHHFSCKEFETILKKEENPYNRDKVTNLTKIIDNLKFKKKVKKILMSRGLELELNGTMFENYEEVLEKIKEEGSSINHSYINTEIEQFYRPLIDIFLRQNGTYF